WRAVAAAARRAGPRGGGDAVAVFPPLSPEGRKTLSQGRDMKPTFYRRTTCLLCGSNNLHLALPLAPSPVGNDYVASADQEQEYYSLNLFLCGDCFNVQVEDVVNPELLFRSYTYSTAHSLGLVEHFRKYADDMLGRTGVAAGA